ncbi:MAG TPA: hypothetical protein VM165_10210 [Planctomycetaceae bacterium]|nr:hypothetical protein [Planctomycetaceae bacterium]
MTSEQRGFFRCIMPGERARGHLIVRSRRLPCVVQNVSIGGFGVEVPIDPEVAESDTAVLETSDGSVPVRIIHTHEQGKTLLVGLLRLETDSTEQTAARACREKQLSLALGVALALFFSGIGFLTLTAERTTEHSRAQSSARWPWTGGIVSSNAPTSPVPTPRPVRSSAPNRPERAAARPATASLSMKLSDTVIEHINRLSDAAGTNAAAQRQAETLHELLTEVAETTDPLPAGQTHTIAREDVQVEYRTSDGTVEIVRVVVEQVQ